MLTFERQTCARCGGSGRYSWNAMHGDTCYGCSGKGYYLSKAGRQAFDAWDAIARPEVPVESLTVGQKIKMRGYRGAFTIAAIEEDTTSDGRVLNDGRYLRLRFTESKVLGAYMPLKGTTIKLGKTAETHRKAWAAFPAGTPGIVEVESTEAYLKGLRD